MKTPRVFAFIAAIVLVSAVGAQSFSFTPDIVEPSESQEFGVGAGLELTLSGEVTSREFIDFGYTSKHFGFVTAFSFHQDDRYPAEGANFPDGTLMDSYFTMDQGGMIFRGLDMELQAGRLQHDDAIDSPYSLFISSKRQPAVLINFHYENEFAFYETRWIELNSNSSAASPAFGDDANETGLYPDRGASLKTYGIKLGNMRFGFQDAAVYVGRSFDLEYFISPMPNYFVQHVKGTPGRPWSTSTNDNDIVGFFWDWKPSKPLYLDAQILIDDLNVFGLGGTPWNPWKAAYSFGARWDTDYGKFSLHHALATKYCFSTTYDSSPLLSYSWAYYPDTRFLRSTGIYQAIEIEDSMIGYYNGENNIALRLDYDTTWNDFVITSNLEFVLSGPKSPSNAWHEFLWYPVEGTKLFDYSIVEKKATFTAQVSRRFGDFIVFIDASAEVAVNALELQAPGDTITGVQINDEAWIWRPGDTTRYSCAMGIGLRYEVPVMKALRK